MKNNIIASKRGKLELVKLPMPQMGENEVLIEVEYSAISTGTEKTIRNTTTLPKIIESGVRKFDQVKKMGLGKSLKTFQKVYESYQPLGYSVTGKIVGVGKDVIGFEKGDLVVATGAARAIHANFVSVPEVYVCKSEEISPQMSLSGVGTIAVNALMKSQVKIGDRVAVIGGGLIGELIYRCFEFAGCDVEIIEISEKVQSRLKESNICFSEKLSRDYDCIVVATDTTKTFLESLDHINYNGSIVIVGYGELNLDRGNFESKQPRLSCVNSYGELANNMFYEMNSGNIAEKYNFDTASKNLKRSVFFLSRSPEFKVKILNKEDCDQIDYFLETCDFSTVVIKWKNG